MEKVNAQEERPQASMRDVGLASFMGSALEWYDFLLYGIAAGLVLNQLYFPNAGSTTATLAALATFGAGFVARPIGGFFFGHFGDRVGRKSVLIITMTLMGLSTFTIGLLPTYEAIGVWAPILLTALRIIQGFGLGGEFAGATLIAVEHAPRHRRGLWGIFPQLGVSGGIIPATLIMTVMSTSLSEEAFLSWGWRVPFLLSILLLFVGLFIRLRILETPDFAKVKADNTEARVPLIELVRRYPKNLLLTFGARLGDSVGSQIFQVFSVAYIATELGLPSTVALVGGLISAVVNSLLLPFIGALSDRIGRKPLLLSGAAIIALTAFPLFLLLDTRVAGLIWLAVTIGGIGNALMLGSGATFYAELFGTKVRYSGISTAVQISAVLGGFAPFIATVLLVTSGGSTWSVSLFLLSIALISIFCVSRLPETYRRDISESE